jgi:hypothetical protein
MRLVVEWRIPAIETPLDEVKVFPPCTILVIVEVELDEVGYIQA